jgi:hypothetical protein
MFDEDSDPPPPFFSYAYRFGESYFYDKKG